MLLCLLLCEGGYVLHTVTDEDLGGSKVKLQVDYKQTKIELKGETKRRRRLRLVLETRTDRSIPTFSTVIGQFKRTLPV